MRRLGELAGRVSTRLQATPAASVAAIIAAWLLVRAGMSFFVHPLISGDQPGYIEAARDFLASEGALLSRRSPAYVLFLAATLRLGIVGVYVVQSLMVLGAALLTWRRLGFWYGLAIAACPFFVTWERALLTETLCLTSLWCGWLLIFWRRSAVDPWLGALLLGVAVLARPILILLPLAAAAAVAFRYDWRRSLVVLAAAYIPVAAAMSHARGPNFVGLNLWIGTWERSPYWMLAGDWPQEARLTDAELRRVRAAGEANDDRTFLNLAVKRYNEAPMEALGTWVVRYPYLWIGTRTEYTSAPTPTFGSIAFKGSMWLLNLATFLLGLAGGVMAVRARHRAALLLLPVAYVGLVYVPFHNTELRYSVVVLPCLIVLAVYFCRQIARSASFGDKLRSGER